MLCCLDYFIIVLKHEYIIPGRLITHPSKKLCMDLGYIYQHTSLSVHSICIGGEDVITSPKPSTLLNQDDVLER